MLAFGVDGHQYRLVNRRFILKDSIQARCLHGAFKPGYKLRRICTCNPLLCGLGQDAEAHLQNVPQHTGFARFPAFFSSFLPTLFPSFRHEFQCSGRQHLILPVRYELAQDCHQAAAVQSFSGAAENVSEHHNEERQADCQRERQYPSCRDLRIVVIRGVFQDEETCPEILTVRQVCIGCPEEVQ